MACYNRNTQEYKNLLNTFANNMQVDSIIVSWQKINKSDKLPSVNEAKQLLKNKKTLFNLKTKDFSETLLSNLSNKNLISKYKDVYYVNNSDKLNKVYDAAVLQSNVNKIKRYLAINNIPIDAVQFTPTRKSIKITVNESLFTPKDLLESSRSWNKEKSRHVIAHLMKLFPTIQVDLVSVFEAKKYYDNLPEWQKSNVSFNKVKSYFDPVNNTVKLIKGRVTDETAIEEMLHPFTDALFVDNKTLFDSLLNEAKIMFPVLNQQIKDSYSDKFGFNQTYRDLELVTQALTRHFKKEYEENPTKTFKERIKEFLEWFAGIINNLHKYITGNDIPSFKRDIFYYQGDQALMEQEEGFEQVKSTEIKPGVAELFESNPELANAIYEALGYKSKYKDAAGIGNLIDELKEIKEPYLKELADLFISLNIDIPLYYSKSQEYAFIVPDNTIIIPKNSYGIIKQKSIIHELLHGGTSNKLLSNPNFKSEIESLIKTIKDSDQQGSLTFSYELQSADELISGLSEKSFVNFLKQKGIYDNVLSVVKNNLEFKTGFQITPQQKQQATFIFSEFLDVYLQDFEQVEKILKEEKIIDKKCS